MKVYQSRTFEKRIKKFSREEKEILDNEIKAIIENPLVGEEKRRPQRRVRSQLQDTDHPALTFLQDDQERNRIDHDRPARKLL
jgi:mRNA-degrading endonuclease RelE of RelBE toxin-antitoxin system